MDFFDRQDQARRLSHGLVALFALAVAGMIVGTYVAVAIALGVGRPDTFLEGEASFFDPGLFLAVAAGVLLLVGMGSSYRTLQLRKGGAAVAELLGGRRVDPGTTDPAEQVLMNVVEEMAIASGVPVPQVFILDGESGINAFAAGHTLNDAAVAVTRGALESFSRDELQGVMAHEFSHILNGDMRLNVRLMGLLFGILLLTVVGRMILRGSFHAGGRRSGGRNGGGGQIALVGVALVVLGYLGVLVGRLIQAAVSRQREYLADAAAVEFTRNPGGIAGALKRIGAASHGSRLQDPHAEEAGHLFFARGMGKAVSGLTATHPPLDRRIRRIEPDWDGSFDLPPARLGGEGSRSRPGRERQGQGQGERTVRGGGLPGGLGALGGAEGMQRMAFLAALLGAAGTLDAGGVAAARALLEGIPDPVRQRLRTPEGAIEGVLALLLPAEGPGGARSRALGRIEERLGARTARAASELQSTMEAAGVEARLPILELALPALRTLPRERAAGVREAVAEVIRADDEIRPFEYAANHLVRRNLPSSTREGLPSRREGTASLDRFPGAVGTLLSLLAWSGGAGGAPGAFQAGSEALAQAGATRVARGLELLPADGVGLDAVDEAMNQLEGTAPGARRALLAAAVATVAHDGEVLLEEAELLRVVAEGLAVPIPPLPLTRPEIGGAGHGRE